jgi:hypothetical protein
MGLKRLGTFQAFLALLLLAACASPAERTLSLHAPLYATLPNGYQPLDPTQPSSMYAAAVAAVPGDNYIRYLERKRGHALNMLSLSGGGQNGAFGAGFLIGWRESGRRPQFDLVGGVSTGALLATHAFLGTPADDAILEEMYTQITSADIYMNRGIFSLLSADSLSDTAPLRALIAKFVTAETLKRVAAAYDENRMLAVGTTNIDYAQTWVWNMTMIAKAGQLELYRDVLLASASFPIVFPPVEIDGHLFVDGAARSNLVIPGMGGTQKPNPPLYGAGNLYLIDNGKVTQPPQALIRALGPVAATTISVMMEQSMQTALTRSYFGTRLLGYTFNMVGIPDDVNVGSDPLAFDPVQMRAAFDAGRALGAQDDPWQNTPPSSGDIPAWALKDLTAPAASNSAP